MPPLRPPHRRQALAGLQAAVGSVAPPNPIVLAWRWRYELTLAAVTTTCVIAVTRTPAPAWVPAGCVVVLAIAAGAALWPPVRRRVAARAWCVITPHRVRAGCAGAWIHSRGGRLPAVLLTTRQPFGERVHLWCHAGSCPQDFQSALQAPHRGVLGPGHPGDLPSPLPAAGDTRCHPPPRRQPRTTRRQHRPDAARPATSTNGDRRRAPARGRLAERPRPTCRGQAQCRTGHTHGLIRHQEKAGKPGILLIYSAPSHRDTATQAARTRRSARKYPCAGGSTAKHRVGRVRNDVWRAGRPGDARLPRNWSSAPGVAVHGAPRRADRTPQKPHNFATRWPIPTGAPRTKRHIPVHLLYVLKARRTAGQQRRCA